jgi:peptidoglycan/LPS O-acetylase OafA/YrhL
MKRISGLDGIRGIAILLVQVFHFSHARSIMPSQRDSIAWRFASVGWLGVDLFFILSGFLITRILLRSKNAPHYFRNFWGRRALRIFPLYYGTLAILFYVLPTFYPQIDLSKLLDRQLWLWAYATNIWTFRYGRWGFDTASIDLNHTWSLAVEEQFYLIWPLIIFLLKYRHFKWVCITVICVSPLARWWMLQAGLAGNGLITLYSFTPVRIDGLAMGALLALYCERHKRPVFSRSLGTAVLFSFAAAGGLLIWRGPMHDDKVISTIGFLITNTACLSLVILALADVSPKLLQNVFSNRALAIFGRYSYGIYLIHRIIQPAVFTLVAGIFIVLGSATSSGWFLSTFVATGIILSLLSAMIVYHLWELPFLRLKDRFFPSEA